MPRFKFNDDISFGYGRTWRVEPTADAQIVELIQAQVTLRDGIPCHRWWIRWCHAPSAQEAWRIVSASPDPRFSSLAIWDRWGNREDPAARYANLSERECASCGEYFKGTEANGQELGGFVQARFYLRPEAPASERVVVLAILLFGEMDMMLRRLRTANFVETLEYRPWITREREQAEAGPSVPEVQTPRSQTPSTPNPRPRSEPPRQAPRLCGQCGGVGRQSCSTCGGSGSRTQSASRTNWEGRTEYFQEQVPCWGCVGGRVMCGRCGGTGVGSM